MNFETVYKNMRKTAGKYDDALIGLGAGALLTPGMYWLLGKIPGVKKQNRLLKLLEAYGLSAGAAYGGVKGIKTLRNPKSPYSMERLPGTLKMKLGILPDIAQDDPLFKQLESQYGRRPLWRIQKSLEEAATPIGDDVETARINLRDTPKTWGEIDPTGADRLRRAGAAKAYLNYRKANPRSIDTIYEDLGIERPSI